jgi:4-aminobutyrate aminotransferase-like enzyme
VELHFAGIGEVNKLSDCSKQSESSPQNVVRILPPLAAGKKEIDILLTTFESTLTKKDRIV